MKVKDLLEELEDVDLEREVILQKDMEGNGYSPLESLWDGAYRPGTTWSGEVGLEELTPEYEKLGFSKEDVIDDGQKAVILCPAN